MQISIYDQPSELAVYTVSVQKNPVKPKNLYLFLCIFCSYQIGQIQGYVSKIRPGLEPTDDVIVLNKCYRCKATYNFQQFDYKKPNITHVVLSKWFNNVLLCWICRQPLVREMGGHMIDIKTGKLIVFPQALKCSNYQCPANYQLIDSI